MADQPRSWQVAFIRGILTLWFLALMVIVVAGTGLLAYGAHYASRIFEGVTIQGVDVGGLSRPEALSLVERELARQALPFVQIQTLDQEWILSTADLGGAFDLGGAVQEAWSLGRSRGFREDLVTRLHLLWWGYRVVPRFSLETGPAQVTLQRIARQVGHPARRAQLWVAGLQARTGESETGRELDVTATREAVQRRVRESLGISSWEPTPRWMRLWQNTTVYASLSAQSLPVELIFREIVPPITQVAGAEERAGLILSAPLTLSFDFPEIQADGSTRLVRRSWCVDQAVLASWLTLQQIQTKDGIKMQVDVDRAKIGLHMEQIAGEIARLPREARFDYAPETATLTTLVPGQNGYALDLPAAQAVVADACLSTHRSVVLPVTVVRPSVTRADLEGLLPLELLSEGESSFTNSTAARLQNIRVATARFQGVAVPPNSTFSFLAHLGLVTAANGYSESWVIYGNRTLLGPGGGVCQVSTTCFRAAFWGGYPIISRAPHAYRVGWYEPPVGLDATVFSPSVDFRFANDTATPILILTEVDEANAKLYFRFYGQLSGRKVRMEGPVTSNPVKAPPPVYEEDPAMAPGQSVQIEWAHDGLDVVLYRIIEQDGLESARQEFFSRYQPWPARYFVGPQQQPEPAPQPQE